jgi:hypothetical protein
VSYFRVWNPLVFEMNEEETSVSDDLCFIESTFSEESHGKNSAMMQLCDSY